MKWTHKSNLEHDNWNGRHNNILFKICECYNNKYYVVCNHTKEDIVLNTLWVLLRFDTLQAAQNWSERLSKDELKRLSVVGLKNVKEGMLE